MANLLKERRFPRGEPDNTAVLWAATRTVATASIYAAIAAWRPEPRVWQRQYFRTPGVGLSGGGTAFDASTIWAAIESWPSRPVRERLKLDPRRVAPPIDAAWIAKAITDFNLIASHWPPIEAWQSLRTRSGRRLDPRSVFYFDDAGWFASAPVIAPPSFPAGPALQGGWAMQSPILVRMGPRPVASGTVPDEVIV